MFCVGTYRTRLENACFDLETMENAKKAQVVLGAYEKRKENISVVWELMKTQ